MVILKNVLLILGMEPRLRRWGGLCAGHTPLETHGGTSPWGELVARVGLLPTLICTC